MIGEMSDPETMMGISPGERVSLRPVRPDDARIISVFKRDPLVKRMALGRGPDSTEAAELEQILAALDSDREDYLVIVDRTDNRSVGYIRLNWMDTGHRFAWLRFALGERRGRGLARDALGTLLRHLFAAGSHRVDAEVYIENERSQALLEGLGFLREGLKREANFNGDEYSDIITYGLLEEDLREP